MNGKLHSRLPSLVALAVLCSFTWPLCLADRTDPCQYFSNNTYIRDPDDCSKGLTCINFKSVTTTTCTGTKPFYDKDKNNCAASLSDHSLCDISCEDYVGRFVKDPKSCVGYYYCQAEDWPRHGLCPENTHFDFDKQECVWTSVSNCNMNEFDMCAVVKDSVNFNDPSSCEKYFSCKKGVLTSNTCKNAYYDALTGKCIQKSLVNCAAHPIPADACGTVKKPKANVFVSDGATCRGALYCAAIEGDVDTNPEWVQCPPNKFFSASAQACINPLEVPCAEDRCEGRNLTFVSSAKTGCRHYYRCENGVKVEELSCGNKFFDEEAGVCTSTIIAYPSCS
ncbi:peritrophin-44 [Stomoxys calcitrans]|uniref:Chitin-binding type-2 domain-containing protein n=1 Tax=Stomoxys calcitrans TaxID=35570 RepID=A0A1I8NQG1_STOCA|nr:peritrophin-44 [Stomoxys calcitrans]